MTAEGLTEAEREALVKVLRPLLGAHADVTANHLVSAGYVPADRLAAVQAERDRLQRWKAEALPVIFGLQDLGKALGLRLGTSITGPDAVDAAHALLARAESAEADRDALRERVEALAEHWQRVGGPDTPRAYGTRLRAALDADRSTDPSAGSERA